MIGLISMGSQIAECDDLPQSGTRARLILINYDDIIKIYSNSEGKITNIVLESDLTGGIVLDAELDAEFSSGGSSSNAYEFTGFRNDVKKSEEVVKRDKSNKRFKHNVGFVIYDASPEQKNNIRNLVRGRVLAIVETRGQGDDSIELLGRECGLQITGGLIRDAHDTSGAFTINLSTPDNGVEFERKLPQTLGIDYENGISIIDDLLGVVPEEPVGEGVFDESFDITFE